MHNSEQLTAIMRSIFTVVRIVNHGAETLGLDKSAIIAMYAVRQTGQARQSAVASACGLDPSTISRHLKSLEDKGLISRSPDPDDRRAQLLALTETGEQLLSDHDTLRLGRLSEALHDWDAADREQLERIMGKLADTLILAEARRQSAIPNLTG